MGKLRSFRVVCSALCVVAIVGGVFSVGFAQSTLPIEAEPWPVAGSLTRATLPDASDPCPLDEIVRQSPEFIDKAAYSSLVTNLTAIDADAVSADGSRVSDLCAVPNRQIDGWNLKEVARYREANNGAVPEGLRNMPNWQGLAITQPCRDKLRSVLSEERGNLMRPPNQMRGPTYADQPLWAGGPMPSKTPTQDYLKVMQNMAPTLNAFRTSVLAAMQRRSDSPTDLKASLQLAAALSDPDPKRCAVLGISILIVGQTSSFSGRIREAFAPQSETHIQNIGAMLNAQPSFVNSLIAEAQTSEHARLLNQRLDQFTTGQSTARQSIQTAYNVRLSEEQRLARLARAQKLASPPPEGEIAKAMAVALWRVHGGGSGVMETLAAGTFEVRENEFRWNSPTLDPMAGPMFAFNYAPIERHVWRIDGPVCQRNGPDVWRCRFQGTLVSMHRNPWIGLFAARAPFSEPSAAPTRTFSLEFQLGADGTYALGTRSSALDLAPELASMNTRWRNAWESAARGMNSTPSRRSGFDSLCRSLSAGAAAAPTTSGTADVMRDLGC